MRLQRHQVVFISFIFNYSQTSLQLSHSSEIDHCRASVNKRNTSLKYAGLKTVLCNLIKAVDQERGEFKMVEWVCKDGLTEVVLNL